MSSTKLILWGCIAAAALTIGVIQTWRTVGPQRENGHLPIDFPHAFLAPADTGNISAVKIWRGQVPPPTSEIDGVLCYPAWRCNNSACPGRSGETPFIFAYGQNQGESASPTTNCPKCLTAFAKAPSERRGDFDPSNCAIYYTPEAEALIVTIQASAR